jgi:hypothetical protein
LINGRENRQNSQNSPKLETLGGYHWAPRFFFQNPVDETFSGLLGARLV